MLYTPTVRPTNVTTGLFGYTSLPKIETSVFRKELRHRSIITYSLPSERVRDLIPEEFDLGETTTLTIESFLDSGRTQFEQTNYRLQVSLHGKPCSWLLGASLGSLSGVTSRHLYALPWHLSAMEFQVALDSTIDRYKKYRLSTQSQWASADWEIVDTGVPMRAEMPLEITDYFVRRDGEMGNYQTIYQTSLATRGQLKAGRCDLLHSLGLLSADELQHPTAVLLQRAVTCEIKPAVSSPGVVLAA
ncbi:MAG: DUF2071 domain-containing protein [Blastocatellia bacterium]|nr:DUF2071 domain-containing protein [Blastocatellia bacterium]